MVDDELCALVDRLEEDRWEGKLQVLINHCEDKENRFEEGELLTRFRSKRSGEVVEWVDNHSWWSYGLRMSTEPGQSWQFGPRNPLLKCP